TKIDQISNAKLVLLICAILEPYTSTHHVILYVQCTIMTHVMSYEVPLLFILECDYISYVISKMQIILQETCISRFQPSIQTYAFSYCEFSISTSNLYGVQWQY